MASQKSLLLEGLFLKRFLRGVKVKLSINYMSPAKHQIFGFLTQSGCFWFTSGQEVLPALGPKPSVAPRGK